MWRMWKIWTTGKQSRNFFVCDGEKNEKNGS